MAAIVGILSDIGNAMNPIFGGAGGKTDVANTISDLGLGFAVPGGGFGVSAIGQNLPPDVTAPLSQALGFVLWLSFAFMAGAIILGGAQLGWARHQGYAPNPAVTRIVTAVLCAALLASVVSIAARLLV